MGIQSDRKMPIIIQSRFYENRFHKFSVLFGTAIFIIPLNRFYSFLSFLPYVVTIFGCGKCEKIEVALKCCALYMGSSVSFAFILSMLPSFLTDMQFNTLVHQYTHIHTLIRTQSYETIIDTEHSWSLLYLPRFMDVMQSS